MVTAFDDSVDKEVLIKYYFYCGYEYKDILDFLATYHNIEISEHTLHSQTTEHIKFHDKWKSSYLGNWIQMAAKKKE